MSIEGRDIDAFTMAYLVCALWSSHDEQGPLDQNYTVRDIDGATVDKMIADCERFKTLAEAILAMAVKDTSIRVNNANGRDGGMSSAGHDFWLTQNGHGAGFWDGDWGDYGDTLTTISKLFRERELYVGDDKKIHGE